MTPASHLWLVEAKHSDFVTMSLRHGLEEAAVIGAVHCVGKVASKGVVASVPQPLPATTIVAPAHHECHFGTFGPSVSLIILALSCRRLCAHLRIPRPTEQGALFPSSFPLARVSLTADEDVAGMVGRSASVPPPSE